MKAVFAATINNADPLAALEVGELPEPQPRPFWSTVSVKAATVNHHDIWSLKGVGLAAEATPMILGTDAAGVLDEDIPVRKGLKAGDEVVLYTVIGADGAGVMPGERRTILSERYPGTMAAKTQVPSANVFAKPANLTLDEAAALGTSWLTAYSLVFASAGVKPGDTMGSREDFARLLRFVEHADIHPVIDSTFGLADARAAFAKALSGDVFGKVVVRI